MLQVSYTKLSGARRAEEQHRSNVAGMTLELHIGAMHFVRDGVRLHNEFIQVTLGDQHPA